MLRSEDIFEDKYKICAGKFYNSKSFIYENNNLALYGGFSRAKCKKKNNTKKRKCMHIIAAIL